MRAAIAVTALAACGYPALPDLGTDAAVANQINGVAIRHYLSDTGVADSPRDFSTGWMFTAITGTGAMQTRHTGTGKSDGTFTVPLGGPTSSWTLEAASGTTTPLILVGSGGNVDLGYDRLGRADQQLVSQPTSVTINAFGLSPWQTNDDLEVISPNAGALWFGPQYYFSSYPTNGTTTLNNQTFQWTNAQLIDASKGDTAQLFQLVSQPAPTPYAALARIGTASGFTQTDGGLSTMNVDLNPVTLDKTVTVYWKRSQFAALVSQAGPGAVFSYDYVAVDALPQAAQRGFYSSSPDLLELYPPNTNTDDLEQTMSYANPFTTSGVPWDEFVLYGAAINVPVALGSQTPTKIVAGAFGSLLASAVRTDGNIAPAIGPVRGLTIAGKSIVAAPATAVGTTPTIQWMAPAIGTATSYEVEIDQLTASSGMTVANPIAYINTTATMLALPDQLLKTGSSYILVVRSYSNPGTDYTKRPYQDVWPSAVFAMVSAQFTP